MTETVTERRKDIADALENMAETLGLAKGYQAILQNASDALRTTPPAPERSKEEVGVKPLNWGEHNGYHADSVIGTYHVRHDGDEPEEWSWSRNGGMHHYFRTQADAQAAAQADYEQRIRSTLELASLHKGEVVAPHIAFRRQAFAHAVANDPSRYAGDLDDVDNDTEEGLGRTLAIVSAAYDWTIDDKGRLFGLVGGDHGYASTGIVIDMPDTSLQPVTPSPKEGDKP